MVFDLPRLRWFLERARDSGALGDARVYASIALLRSERMAERANQSLLGTPLPEDAYRRIAGGEGIDLAVETAIALAAEPSVDALHVIPLGDERSAGQVAAAFRAASGAPVERAGRLA